MPNYWRAIWFKKEKILNRSNSLKESIKSDKLLKGSEILSSTSQFLEEIKIKA